MPAPYSYDLRAKVLKYLEAGNKLKDTSKLFNISSKTIIEWKKLKKETGDVKAKEGYRTGHRRIITETEKFKKFVEENAGKSTVELARLWPQQVCGVTISRLLNKLGYSYKKNFYAPQKGRWCKK